MRGDNELVDGYEVTKYALPDAGASTFQPSRSSFLLRLDTQDWPLAKHTTKHRAPRSHLLACLYLLTWTAQPRQTGNQHRIPQPLRPSRQPALSLRYARQRVIRIITTRDALLAFLGSCGNLERL